MALSISRRAIKSRFTNLPAPAALALVYFTAMVTGAVLLSLPFAHDGSVGYSDAAFTAVSAVTVTGLIVVDTGSQFTFYGELIIAILIQLGGLGLMTFAVLLLSALGIPVGLPQRMILREDLNQTSLSDLSALTRIILTLSLSLEAIGAAVLATVFVPDLGWKEGLWQAIFHSISAFNNAGFSLFSDSLMGYAGDPVVNITITFMFIIGGIGFVVLADINRHRRWRPLALHTKLMLVGTASITAISCVAIGALEWTNPDTIGSASTLSERAWMTWFQAVTPRTAGFNTLDTGAMREETALLTMALMFVGGGSTSTAGGIKLTTLIVLIIATIAFFRRNNDLHAFGRRLESQEVFKVLALTTVSALLVFTILFVLLIVEDLPFLVLAFETVSAFGTVGLSMGATGDLSPLGRALIMVLMFLGRVGPLTLGFFLAQRITPRVRRPKGQVYLG